jgi:hypothetical protein
MMGGLGTTFLEQVRPVGRKALVTARRLAMGGRLAAAVELLQEEINKAEAKEQALLGMTQAELLYLDDSNEEASQVFEVFVRPRLEAVPPEVRFAFELNRVSMKLSALDSGAFSDFYHLHDQIQAAGVVWEDYRKLVRAWESVEGQHYREELELLWQSVIRGYRQGCWTVFRPAMSRLGRLCLRLDELPLAAFAAIVAMDTRLADEVALALVNHRDENLNRTVLEQVLSTANLRRHFAVGCHILHGAADVIPDDAVGNLGAWLLPRAASTESPYAGTAGPVYRAWHAMEPIAHRMPHGNARQVLETLVNHPLWKGEGARGLFIPVRKQMVETANHLVVALAVDELPRFAEQALPLALERRWDTDYPAVINLLCHIAERGGEQLKQMIGGRLFESRQQDLLHGQIAGFFGKSFLTPANLARLVKQVCETHRLTVQRLPRGQEAKALAGSIMQRTQELADGAVVVQSAMSMVDWATLVRQRRRLSMESRRLLAHTAMDLIGDPDNLLTNRESLLMQFMEMADVLPHDVIEAAIQLLEPMARGHIEQSALVPSGTGHPLQAVSEDLGRPRSLQAMALIAFARLGRRRAKHFRRRLEEVLGQALIHPDVEIRRGAFAAFRDFPGTTGNALLAVLMGTRDADPEGAITAFAALAVKEDLRLKPYQWQLLLYSVQAAALSPNVRLRRHAAAMLARRIGLIPEGVVRDQALAVLGTFARDVCASVREAAVPAPAGPDATPSFP